jgi:catechol 2,3-dioxygenase-like lactoylglutathione lyase family enzyme
VSHSDAPPEPPAAVLETVLYCTSENEEPTRRFYEDLLRLKRVSRSAYRLGSQVFLLFNSDESRVQEEPPPHGASGSVHTCFVVPSDAYDRWKGYLEANGVRLIDEITWDRGIRSFYFNDPAGNLLEIADGDMWPP